LSVGVSIEVGIVFAQVGVCSVRISEATHVARGGDWEREGGRDGTEGYLCLLHDTDAEERYTTPPSRPNKGDASPILPG